ncbi:MAG: hypothetical protein FWD64_04420, partial [Acidobacteriaceae bacterium]|nr:hypothetical protein [Acidobacteriaceae bacterium]
TPAAGAVLPVGSNTLTAVFTPADPTTYATVTKTVTLTVTKATPVVTWAAPAAIPSGTALDATQLNATASVPGTFSYSPAAGVVLPVGSNTLTAVFTPDDPADYAVVTKTTTLKVQ